METKHDYMTEAECANMAIDCQDASNLAGLAHTLGALMPSLLNAMRQRGKDTTWANQHPVVYMFLYKMLDLNAPYEVGFLSFSKAYEMTKRIAAGESGVY